MESVGNAVLGVGGYDVVGARFIWHAATAFGSVYHGLHRRVECVAQLLAGAFDGCHGVYSSMVCGGDGRDSNSKHCVAQTIL